MIRGYVPSGIVPVPMVSCGTRAVAGSHKPAESPGPTVWTRTADEKRSMEKQAQNQRQKGELNRTAAQVLRELDERLAKAAER